MRSCGVASARSVGFDSGKITGRRTRSAMARTTASWKAWGWPDVPMSTVGRALATTSPRPIRSGDAKVQRRQRGALLHEGRLKRLQARHALDQQAVAVDQIEAAARFGLRNTGIDHRPQQQRANAGAGGAGAKHRDALLGERRAGDIDRAQQRADGDRGGALDVVVEGAKTVAIARQQPVGVADGEIFPMQQHVRPALAHGSDEGGDERIIGLAAHRVRAASRYIADRPDARGCRCRRRG